MNRAVTIVWIFLIALTTASWLLAGGHVGARMLFALAAVKFALVAWWFMDMRAARAIWSLAVGGVLVLCVSVFLLLA